MALNNTLIAALADTYSVPVLLLQLNIPQIITKFVVDSSGIYKLSVLSAIYDSIDPVITSNMPTFQMIGIASIRVDNVQFPEVTVYTNTIDGRAAALSAEPSYIYDAVNDILYVRFDEDYNPPFIHQIYAGSLIGISDQDYYDFVNNIFYESRLNNTPPMAQRKDPLFYQQISFDGFDIDQDNSDYFYDDKAQSTIFGSVATFYLGARNLEFQYFEKIKQARLTKYKFSGKSWITIAKDSRKVLSNELPINYIDEVTYPDADEYAYDLPKPLLLGFVRYVPCLSLDENAAAPANYRFMFADTSYFPVDVTGAIIRVAGNIVTPSIAPNGSTGIFSLDAADYEPGQDVTYTGYGLTDSGVIINQLEIMEFLLETFCGISYNSLNFNTTEWDAAKAIAPDIGIALYNKTSVISVIEKIVSTTASGFILERDGRWTWRKYDPDGDPVIQIHNDDWDEEPEVDGNYEEILSSATVKYGLSCDSGRWIRETDDTYKDYVLGNNNFEKNEEFETLFVHAADALAFAGEIMEKSKDERIIITGTVGLQFMNAEIGKKAEIEVNRFNGIEWLGILNCEIIGVEPDIENNRMTITFRKQESIESFT